MIPQSNQQGGTADEKRILRWWGVYTDASGHKATYVGFEVVIGQSI